MRQTDPAEEAALLDAIERWLEKEVRPQVMRLEHDDIYPHERRRELRGMRVFAAWLNHDDARSINSIDSYVEHNGRHYIRHYLQDFGSNLGSGSTSAQQPRGGF